jgi:hypothetical protein
MEEFAPRFREVLGCRPVPDLRFEVSRSQIVGLLECRTRDQALIAEALLLQTRGGPRIVRTE